MLGGTNLPAPATAGKKLISMILTTKCSQLKLVSADGKKYATDCFSQDDIIEVIKNIPSKQSLKFLDWFTYSDNSIDGQSKLKAYNLFLCYGL